MAYAELIGDPVAHSLSPAIYRHWLEAFGMRGRDGRLEGGNEDVAGRRGALGGSVRPHMRVAIIGAGGAARAAAVFAAAIAPAKLWLLCRRPEQGLALLGELGLDGGVGPIDPIPEVDLLIQATPALDEWDLGALPSDAVVLDMLYVPPVTPLMAAARARGMIGVGGISMLIHQARESFAALFGVEPPAADDPRLLERLGR